MITIAAKFLEAAEEDLEITDGNVHVRGVPTRGLDLGDIAMRAYMNPSALPGGMSTGIEATRFT